MGFIESLLGKKDAPEKDLCCECCGIVEVPDVRQRDHFSCGAACSCSVGQYFGVGPDALDEWKKELGTTVQESTHPAAIERYFRKLGCEVEADSLRTLDSLAECCRRDMPTIVCLQDYGPRVDPKARFGYGHYIVVIGHVGTIGGGYVVAQDPSEDNVLAGGDNKDLKAVGSVQKPGRIIIADADFLNAWKDRDVDGNKFIRWGCSVGRPPKKDDTDEDKPKAKLSVTAIGVPWGGIPQPKIK